MASVHYPLSQLWELSRHVCKVWELGVSHSKQIYNDLQHLAILLPYLDPNWFVQFDWKRANLERLRKNWGKPTLWSFFLYTGTETEVISWCPSGLSSGPPDALTRLGRWRDCKMVRIGHRFVRDNCLGLLLSLSLSFLGCIVRDNCLGLLLSLSFFGGIEFQR